MLEKEIRSKASTKVCHFLAVLFEIGKHDPGEGGHGTREGILNFPIISKLRITTSSQACVVSIKIVGKL